MKKILAILVVLCALIFCGTKYGNDKKPFQKKPEARFNREASIANFLVTSRKGMQMEIKEKNTLSQLQNLLKKSNIDFLETTAPGKYYLPVICEAVFTDKMILNYAGSLYFYKDRTYLNINFNEDEGWMSGPSIGFRLDPTIDSKILRDLRSAFNVNADQLMDWKSPDSN